MGRSIALVNNHEDGYGDGPDGSELGGHHATVEAARSVHLTNFKKFVIIYIQAKELSDIVPHTKGSYSKASL